MPEQLQQVVSRADERPLPLHLLQAPQQELPESPALLDLSEHRLRRLHPQGVALTAPFRPQLPPHPVPGRQSLGYSASGRRLRSRAMAGLLRGDERVHSQGADFLDCLGPVVPRVGGYLLGRRVPVLAMASSTMTTACCFVRTQVGGTAPPQSPDGRMVHHRLAVVGLLEIPPSGAGHDPGLRIGEVALRLVIRALRGGSCPRTSACSASAWAWASSAALASLILRSRPSRKANSSGNSSPRLSRP